jgi:hypothetical protein
MQGAVRKRRCIVTSDMTCLVEPAFGASKGLAGKMPASGVSRNPHLLPGRFQESAIALAMLWCSDK